MFRTRILGAAVILLVVVAGFYLSEPGAERSTNVGAAGSAPVFAKKRLQDLQAFENLSTGAPYRILRESDGAWAVKDRRFVVLDPRALRKLFDALFHLEFTHSIPFRELPNGGAEVGLLPPSAVVVVEWVGGKSERLEFGAKNPVTGRRYVRLNGASEVSLIDDYAASVLVKSLDEVRLSIPFALVPDEVVKLEVSGTMPFALSREASGWGVSQQGKTSRGDGELIKQKLRELSLIQAGEFIDPPDARIQEVVSNPPTLEFDFWFRKGDAPLHFKVWERDSAVSTENGELVAPKAVLVQRGEWPTLFRLQKRTHRDFLLGADAFRDRKPLRRAGVGRFRSLCLTQAGESVGVTATDSGGYRVGRSCAGTATGDPVSVETEGRIKKLLQRISVFPVLTHLDENEVRNVGATSGKNASELSVEWREQGTSGDEVYSLAVLQPVSTSEVSDGTERGRPYYARFQSPGEEVIAIVSGGEVEALWKNALTISSEQP